MHALSLVNFNYSYACSYRNMPLYKSTVFTNTNDSLIDIFWLIVIISFYQNIVDDRIILNKLHLIRSCNAPIEFDVKTIIH